jgi:hypothetical protein
MRLQRIVTGGFAFPRSRRRGHSATPPLPNRSAAIAGVTTLWHPRDAGPHHSAPIYVVIPSGPRCRSPHRAHSPGWQCRLTQRQVESDYASLGLVRGNCVALNATQPVDRGRTPDPVRCSAAPQLCAAVGADDGHEAAVVHRKPRAWVRIGVGGPDRPAA